MAKSTDPLAKVWCIRARWYTKETHGDTTRKLSEFVPVRSILHSKRTKRRRTAKGFFEVRIRQKEEVRRVRVDNFIYPSQQMRERGPTK